MNSETRNDQVKEWLHTKIKMAKTASLNDFGRLKELDKISETIGNLIRTDAKGFRGVVITSLAGHFINPQFSPLIDFYACNPRAIFENAIWYALTDHNIPCGKSDPLNVAKNIKILDSNWAKGRRPEKSAIAAADFLRIFFNEKDAKQKSTLEDFFFYNLIQYANEISSIVINKIHNDAVTRQQLASNLIRFSLAAPESGATPQMLTAVTMRQLYSRSTLTVCGGDESVFGTNTTSKKPADIWIEDNGKVILLYEITLKKVDQKRLEDIIESTRSINVDSAPLTFICRIPEDTSSLVEMKDHSLNYKGFQIEFIDFAKFIETLFSLIDRNGAQSIHQSMSSFVELVTTSPKTKAAWNQIFNG